MRNRCLWVKPPVYGIFLGRPELTNTPPLLLSPRSQPSKAMSSGRSPDPPERVKVLHALAHGPCSCPRARRGIFLTRAPCECVIDPAHPGFSGPLRRHYSRHRAAHTSTRHPEGSRSLTLATTDASDKGTRVPGDTSQKLAALHPLHFLQGASTLLALQPWPGSLLLSRLSLPHHALPSFR